MTVRDSDWQRVTWTLDSIRNSCDAFTLCIIKYPDFGFANLQTKKGSLAQRLPSEILNIRQWWWFVFEIRRMLDSPLYLWSSCDIASYEVAKVSVKKTAAQQGNCVKKTTSQGSDLWEFLLTTEKWPTVSRQPRTTFLRLQPTQRMKGSFLLITWIFLICSTLSVVDFEYFAAFCIEI